MHPLPSLNHLRSFQIIGKHLNLVKAANDAHLTPSALSHQLNLLESQIGIKLFTRTGRGLAFTHAGEELYSTVDECLNRLRAVVNSLREGTKSTTLIVNALPAFATRWLLPRFSSFMELHGGVEIRVSTLDVDFERDSIDCAIQYGPEPHAGLGYDFLREEKLIVVCSPNLITAENPLSEPGHLLRHKLLHARSRHEGPERPEPWGRWLRSVGEAKFSGMHDFVVETRNLLIQAAKSGLGVAVIDPLMVQNELASGELVQPLPQVAKSGCGYYLVYPSAYPLPERAKAFRDWIIDEMQKEASAWDKHD